MIGSYKIIGVFVANLDDEFRARYVQRIASESERYGYRVIVYNALAALYGEDDVKGLYAVHDLINYDVLDAMVVMTQSIYREDVLQKILNECKLRNIPLVFKDKLSEGNCFYGVVNQLEDSFEKLVRHVIMKHGVRDIVMVAGTKGNIYSQSREDIFKKVVQEQGIPLTEDMILYGEFWHGPAKAVVEKEILKKKRLPQAFICANDAMALAIIELLSEYGYRVPQDCIVTGVDGSYANRYHVPNLTTCRLMIEKDADETIAILADLFCGKVTKRNRVIPHELFIGESCGCMAHKAAFYGDSLEQLYNRNCLEKEADRRCYQLIMNVMADPTFDTLIAGIQEIMMRASILAVNEDIDKNIRRIEESLDKQNYTDMVYELAARNHSGESINGKVIPYKNLLPNLEFEINNKQPFVVSPVFANDRIFGYYGSYLYHLYDESYGMYRNIRAIVVCLNNILNSI